jgi:hypothetical protein
LAIERRGDTQRHAVSGRFLHRHSIDSLVFGAVHKKYVCLTQVPTLQDLCPVRSDAPGIEDHRTVTEPTRLALRAHELPVEIEHQVVAMVDAPRQQDGVTPAM